MTWYRRSQEEGDDSASILDETVKELMDVHVDSSSTCETIYDMGDKVRVRLWIITGGTPALSFADYSFQQRYPITDKRWTDKNWDNEKGHFKHQPGPKQCPPTYDVLPDGWVTLHKFVADNLPKKQAREKRYAALPVKGELWSKKWKDSVDNEIVVCKTELDNQGFGPVTYSSRSGGGRGDDKIPRAPRWWQEYAALVNPLFDRDMAQGILPGGYERLSDHEYQELVWMLKYGRDHKEFHWHGIEGSG